MAVVFLQEFSPSGDRSTTNYDTISERLGVDQDPPVGLIVHSAGFGKDGSFRIYDVWESMEHLERFQNDRLMPIVNELMASSPDAVPPVRQESYELHAVQIGVGSGVS